LKKEVRNHPIEKGNPKVIRGWIMYDWANSVYQLTIASTIFPIYYNQVTRSGPDDFTVRFFGYEVVNTVLYSWSIAAAYLVVAFLSPMLSSLADYTGRRKTFMQFFTWLGALSCGTLFFFDASNVELGIIAFTMGTIGYGGSIVYYNSFLPVICAPEEQDKVSARGYSMGYLGGVVLLLFNLLMILKPGLFGITDPFLPARISFLTVFIWWIGFSQITFRRLPRYTYRKRHEEKDRNILLEGYRELDKVLQQIRRMRKLSFYLTSFFFIMMGLITTMFMAALYGEKELGLKDEVLIPTILIIQLVGMGGAWLFARLSARLGNLKTLLISVFMWIFICIGAFFIVNSIEFMIAAFFIGLVMGGTQALARSTYSKMLPATTTDHTSFFSFYDVMEKLATVAGTFSFGIIEAITGSMRYSVLAIAVFFVIGIIFLLITLNVSSIENRASVAL
jgi:UMF1 family MFS transporter